MPNLIWSKCRDAHFLLSLPKTIITQPAPSPYGTPYGAIAYSDLEDSGYYESPSVESSADHISAFMTTKFHADMNTVERRSPAYPVRQALSEDAGLHTIKTSFRWPIDHCRLRTSFRWSLHTDVDVQHS